MKLWHPLTIPTDYKSLPVCDGREALLRTQNKTFREAYHTTQAILEKVKADPEYAEHTARMAAVGFAPKLDYVEAESGEEIHGEFGKHLIPDLRSVGMLDESENLKDEIGRMWPRCPQSGKPMQFIGWVNAGYYPFFIHELTGENLCQSLCSPLGHYSQNEPMFLFHFFIGEQQPLLGWSKDIHIIVDIRNRGDSYSDLAWEPYEAAVKAFLKENPRIDNELLNPPVMKLGVPEPRFDLEIAPKEEHGNGFYFEWDDYAEETPKHADFTLFGQPRSQQDAKRPICPNRYPNIQAMTPVLNFSDSEHDISHQFYADLRGEPRGRGQYAVVDSSNT